MTWLAVGLYIVFFLYSVPFQGLYALILQTALVYFIFQIFGAGWTIAFLLQALFLAVAGLFR